MSTQPCIFEVLDMFLQQIFSSLEIRLNASSKSWKSLYIKHFYILIYPPLTSILPSQRVLRGQYSCQKLVALIFLCEIPSAGTYPRLSLIWGNKS